MSFEILDISQKNIWTDCFKRLPLEQQDIYFTPEYYELSEKNGEGKAQCFVFEDNGKIALYPFLINSVNILGYKLNKEYFDIQGAYGYNGVVTNSYNKNFIDAFYKEFNIFCKNENIIAEFTRFNPILKNHLFGSNFEVLSVNKNIVLNLIEDDIWMNSYGHSTKKNINKALRNKLNVKCFSGTEIKDDLVSKFVEIYVKTMDRNSADNFYYFTKKYFEEISKILGESAKFFFTYKKEKIISCELVLCGSEIGYSFLGGTLTDYYELRPNEILKHKIIEALKKEKFKYFCLGGGIIPNDGIFNYKKKFALNGVYDFFIGKKIHNQKVYDKIIEQWEGKTLYKNNKKLLKYRDI